MTPPTNIATNTCHATRLANTVYVKCQGDIDPADWQAALSLLTEDPSRYAWDYLVEDDGITEVYIFTPWGEIE